MSAAEDRPWPADDAQRRIGPRHIAGDWRAGTDPPQPPPESMASSTGGSQPGRSTRRRGPGSGRNPPSGPQSAGGGGGGESGGSDRTRPTPARAVLSVLTEMVVVLGMALVLSLVIKTFLVQAFFIPSQSMEDTLLTGDRVVVSKLTPGPFQLHRGDIVVFKDPGGWLAPASPIRDGGLHRLLRETMTFVGLLPQDSGEHLIKRVIGLPGDTVKCCDAQGRLAVDGRAIEEPYLYPGDRPSEDDFSVTVPPGRIWVMGDHRSVSKDSRYNQTKFVPIDSVVGKAFVLVWPPARAGGLGVPPEVFAGLPGSGS